jgi:hypothetical protein
MRDRRRPSPPSQAAPSPLRTGCLSPPLLAAALWREVPPQRWASPRAEGLDDHQHLHPHGDHRQKQRDRSERQSLLSDCANHDVSPRQHGTEREHSSLNVLESSQRSGPADLAEDMVNGSRTSLSGCLQRDRAGPRFSGSARGRPTIGPMEIRPALENFREPSQECVEGVGVEQEVRHAGQRYENEQCLNAVPDGCSYFRH